MTYLLFNAGHGEYLPEDHRYRVVYDPGAHETRDKDGHTLGLIVNALNLGVGDDEIRDVLADLDDNVEWFTVIGVLPEHRMQAFVSLCCLLGSSTPHGDDDVFDYWPSGVRLARALAPTDEDRTRLEVLVKDTAEEIAFDLAELGL